MKTIQRDWDWWAYHYRVIHRSQIPSISQWDDDLVDMIILVRELAYEGEFEAVLLLSGSFGFFDDATNRDVLARMVRALAPGGRVLIDVSDPTQMVVRPPQRSWSQYGGGYGLRKTWWEPETCTHVSEFMFIDGDGVLNMAAEPERIRFYSLPEWRALFSDTGLAMTHSLADTRLPLVPYGRENYGNLVVVGQKR